MPKALTAKQQQQAQQLAQTITVRRREDEPEDVVLVAQAILACAEAADRLLTSGLTLRALTVLLHDLTSSGVTRTQIRDVLLTLPKLRVFLTEPVQK